jgi:hypothetical protein
VLAQGLERVADRRENPCAERNPARAVAPPVGELLPGVLPSSRLSISLCSIPAVTKPSRAAVFLIVAYSAGFRRTSARASATRSPSAPTGKSKPAPVGSTMPPTGFVMTCMPRRSYPSVGRVDSRKQAIEVRRRTISANRWTRDPCGGIQAPAKTSRDAARIRPEDDDFELVSYAPEDRCGVENPRLPFRSQSILIRLSQSGDSLPSHSSQAPVSRSGSH